MSSYIEANVKISHRGWKKGVRESYSKEGCWEWQGLSMERITHMENRNEVYAYTETNRNTSHIYQRYTCQRMLNHLWQ